MLANNSCNDDELMLKVDNSAVTKKRTFEENDCNSPAPAPGGIIITTGDSNSFSNQPLHTIAPLIFPLHIKSDVGAAANDDTDTILPSLLLTVANIASFSSLSYSDMPDYSKEGSPIQLRSPILRRGSKLVCIPVNYQLYFNYLILFHIPHNNP